MALHLKKREWSALCRLGARRGECGPTLTLEVRHGNGEYLHKLQKQGRNSLQQMLTSNQAGFMTYYPSESFHSINVTTAS